MLSETINGTFLFVSKLLEVFASIDLDDPSSVNLLLLNNKDDLTNLLLLQHFEAFKTSMRFFIKFGNQSN